MSLAPQASRGRVRIFLAARLVWWRCSVWLEPELARAARLAEWQLLRVRLWASVASQARGVQAAISLAPIAGAVAATLAWAVLLASSNVTLGTVLNPKDLGEQVSSEVRMTIDCAPVLQPNDLAVIADCATNPPS